MIAESNGRAGTGPLSAMLRDHRVGSTPTRNELEELFLDLCRRADVPRPRVNVWIALGGGEGFEADFLWAEESLIAEADGWESHGTRRAFEHDHRRDRRLRLAGYDVIRFTSRDMTERPEEVVTQLRQFVGG